LNAIVNPEQLQRSKNRCNMDKKPSCR